jgi:hypothetical protein
MNRLDQHISNVRTRMIATRALWALAWAGIVYTIIVWAAILIYKLVRVTLPHQFVVFEIALGIACIAAVVYAIVTRPSAKTAAVEIDARLALKEKFSTALFVRESSDPFARAAVRDAENTAENVSLHKRFPIQFPRAFGGTAGMILLALLTAYLLPEFDLFGVQSRRVAKAAIVDQAQAQARETVRKAIAEIAAAPKIITDKQDIKLAVADLQAMQNKPDIDPTHAKNTADKAMQELQQAMKDRVKKNSEYVQAQQEVKEFSKLSPPSDDTGPVADAQKAIAQGKYDEAVADLSKAVNNFEKMTPKDQQQTAQQTKQLANALQKLANDPKVQQQMQKQLQQMGANQQQAQQMMNQMQAAAAGDKGAQQAVQKAATQLAQQMNQQGGQSAQQQRQNAQQVQQAIQQMQQQTNSQASAQQLSQAAQALAQAMQQAVAAAPNGQQQANNPQGQQQNKQGQPMSGQQASGQKQNQGQPQGQQPGQNQQPGQGQQPGQQAAGKDQRMADAANQMQQQLQQMQAVANDAQQVAAGQKGENGKDPGQQPGDNDGQQGNKGQQGNGHGNQGGQQWAQNKGQNQPGAGGGVGKGGAEMPRPEVAPFQVKDETDLSEKNGKGKVLASTFVKAGSIRGESKMDLQKALPVVNKDTPDEIDEQRIPRQDQDAVRGYFNNLEKETQK